MGRKKIQISRITDERNRQVIMSTPLDADVSRLRKNLTLIAINLLYIFESNGNFKGFLTFDFYKEILESVQASCAAILKGYLNTIYFCFLT